MRDDGLSAIMAWAEGLPDFAKAMGDFNNPIRILWYTAGRAQQWENEVCVQRRVRLALGDSPLRAHHIRISAAYGRQLETAVRDVVRYLVPVDPATGKRP